MACTPGARLRPTLRAPGKKFPVLLRKFSDHRETSDLQEGLWPLRSPPPPSPSSACHGVRSSLSAFPARACRRDGRGAPRGRLVTRFPPLSLDSRPPPRPLPPFLSRALSCSFSPRVLTIFHPILLRPCSWGEGERASALNIEGNNLRKS